MKSTLTGIGVIAVATVIEAIRNRLLLIAVAFVVVLVGLSVSAASVSISEHSRLIIDVGLAAASAIGTIIAVALTISSFAGELRNRTAYPILARPIPRWAFVLGKYFGLVIAMEIVVTVMILATAVVVWLFGEPVPGALWGSMWLAWFEMALVVAIALLFSTLAVPALAATYAAGLILAGNLAGDIQMLGEKLADQGKASGSLLTGLYYLLPDIEKLSLRTQAANYLEIPTGYLWQGAGYALAYSVVALVIAAWVFDRRRAV